MPTLHDATKIYLGTASQDRVYLGSTQVWPFAAWSPSAIPGLVVWLDATTVTPVGQEVRAWTNLGSGPQPVISTAYPMTDLYTLNGKRLVTMNVGQGHIRFTGTGVSTNFTFAYVSRLRAGNARVVGAIYPDGGNFLVGYHGGAMNVAYDGIWFTPNATTTNDGSWHLYSGDKNGPGAPPRLFSNGAYMSTGSGGDSFGGTLAISGYEGGAGVAETGDIDFAEIVLYNSVLSDADRQQVENYLKTKWAV